MEDFFKVKHSFNAGDLIALLPGLQHLYEKTGKKTILYQRIGLPAFYYEGAAISVANDEGHSVSQNKYMFEMLKPLIEHQPYIESFLEWEGQQVDIDIDQTRDSRLIPMPAGQLHQYAWAIFPDLSCDLSKKWIHSSREGMYNDDYSYYAYYRNKIIINRTERYQNAYITYHFLKDYENDIVFVGTQKEYENFTKQWKISCKYAVVNNFLELAKIINLAKGFLGNQSFCWHLADAQKQRRILELCPQFPNTFPTGANGHSFYHQKSLEHYFKELVNDKTINV